MEKAQSLAKKTKDEVNPETSLHRKKGESKAAFSARLNEQQERGDRKESTVVDISHAIVHQANDEPSKRVETQADVLVEEGTSNTEPKLAKSTQSCFCP